MGHSILIRRWYIHECTKNERAEKFLGYRNPAFVRSACHSQRLLQRTEGSDGAAGDGARRCHCYRQRASIPDYLEAPGTVRAAQSSQIASQMMGNIAEMRVHEGDRVTRGEVLAVIDDAQPRAGLDRATAAQAAAREDVAAADADFAWRRRRSIVIRIFTKRNRSARRSSMK